MIWTCLFLSASAYTWYLFVLACGGQQFPVLFTGLAGLFFISVLPAYLAYAFNDFLLNTKPTVLRIIFINVLAMLLAGLSTFYLTASAGITIRSSLSLPACWQLFSWSCGLYFLFTSGAVTPAAKPAGAEPAVEASSGVEPAGTMFPGTTASPVVEPAGTTSPGAAFPGAETAPAGGTSNTMFPGVPSPAADSQQNPGFPPQAAMLATGLGLAIPAITLLNYLELALFPLMSVLIGWFILLALSLALDGTARHETAAVRYDLIIFHTLMPILLAFAVYLAAFARDIKELLCGAKHLLLSLLALLVRLLSFLFAQPPGGGSEKTNGHHLYLPQEEGLGRIVEPPLWIFLLLFALILFFVLKEVLPLLRDWLGSRLAVSRRLPRKRPRLRWRILLTICSWLALLMGSLFGGVAKLAGKGKLCCLRLYTGIIGKLHGWLPARSPREKIQRSYHKFLGWGNSRGLRRGAGETPLEYARRLQEHCREKTAFPRQEVLKITGIFLEARYSSHPVTPQQGDEAIILLRKIVQGNAPPHGS